jgi:hypothetical protein
MDRAAVAEQIVKVAKGLVAGDEEARELENYITSDSDLYRTIHTPIIKNLMRKRAKGAYSHDLAVKGFMHLVDEGAKKYVKEHDAPGAKAGDVFDRATRLEVAKSMTDYFETEADLGNYDNMAQASGVGLAKRAVAAPFSPQEAVKVIESDLSGVAVVRKLSSRGDKLDFVVGDRRFEVTAEKDEGGILVDVNGRGGEVSVGDAFDHIDSYVFDDEADLKGSLNKVVADLEKLQQEEESSEPQEEDIVMGDARGGGVDVSVVGGKHLGNFGDRDEAEEFIRKHMRQHGLYPSVWFISDHGNPHLVTDIHRRASGRVRLTSRVAAGDGASMVKNIAKMQREKNRDLSAAQASVERQNLDIDKEFNSLVAFVKQHQDQAKDIVEALKGSVYVGELSSRGVDAIERISGEKLSFDSGAAKNRPKWAIVSYR